MNLRIAMSAVAASAALAGAVPAVAHASFLVDRGATKVSIQADTKGEALISYKKAGKTQKVILWGGENASLTFGIGRQAGYHSKHDYTKKKFPNSCKVISPTALDATVPALSADASAYDSQETLLGVVAACKAKDGSIWMAQSWARQTPDFGGVSAPNDLRVSHYTGQVATLWIKADWSYSGMWNHMYGQLSYLGKGWWGKGGAFGASVDGKARNVAIDSLASDYPTTKGWARVNAILTDQPNGQFCFGFAPKFHDASEVTAAFKKQFPLWPNALADTGLSSVNQYRAEVPGPGVSPDVQVVFHLNDPSLWPVSSDSASGHRASGDAVDAIQQAAFAQESALAAGEPSGASCGALWNGQ